MTHYLVPWSARAFIRAIRGLAWALGRGRLGSVARDIIPELARVRSENGWLRCFKHAVRLSGLLLAASSLLELARERGWHHVHVHFCSDAAQVALFAHLIAGLPYSMTLHGALADYGPNQRQKWKHAAFAIVITDTLVKEIRRELGDSLPPIVEVAPMGVNIETFTRTTPFEPWDGGGPARVFSCGRLNPSKGHDDVIRAVPHLLEAGIDVRLAIAGEDDQAGNGYRVELQRLIDQLGVGDRVVLLGAVSEEDVKQQLEAAHVFTLASHAEALGIATVEAMSLGVPVVVTGGGGVRELVNDGATGLLVGSENPEQLAAALVRVLKFPDFASQLGAGGRSRVLNAFDSRRSAELLARLVEGVR